MDPIKFDLNASIDEVNISLQKAAEKTELYQTDIDDIIRDFAKELMTKQTFLINDFASNRKRSDQWNSIVVSLRKIDPKSFIKLQPTIKKIQSEGQKIINACEKFGISLSDYQAFIQDFAFDVNGEHESDTPLNKAINANNLPLIKLLIELGAEVNRVDALGDTPFMHAVSEDSSTDIVKYLKACGASVNDFSEIGWTPLRWAISNNNPDMVTCLKECGADLNLRDKEGVRPVEHAIKGNKPEMVRCLKEAGADLNVSGQNGTTPLLSAISLGYTDLVKLLISLGADLEKPDQFGYTPLIMAITGNHLPIIHLLEQSGADQSYAKKFLNIKFLAHMWGLSGKASIITQSGQKREIALEKFNDRYVMRQLHHYVASFFNSPEFKKLPISEKAREEIEEALEKAANRPIDAVEIVSRIQSGKPAVVSGGTPGHSIAMVLFQDKLLVCNRGAGWQPQAVEIYRLPAKDITVKLIENLSQYYDNPKAFSSMIHQLHLPKLEGYNQKDLKVDNCTLASAKAAFGALCRLYTTPTIGRNIYKTFTKYAREVSLVDFLGVSSPEDEPVLNALRAKASKKKGFERARKLLDPKLVKGMQSFSQSAFLFT